MSAVRGGQASGLAVATLVATATLALSGWVITLRFTTLEPFEDFRFHNRAAGLMAAGGPLEVPHPLYHVLVAALAALLPGLGLPGAGLAVALAAQAALGVIAYFGLRTAAHGRLAAPALAALGLTLVAPLNWWTPGSREFYFGYLFPNAFHNPTIILLRPVALGLFLGCAGALGRSEPPPPARVAGLALLTVLCTLAKPSYLICLLPALAFLLLLGRRGNARARDVARGLLAGVLLPGLVVVAAQAWFTLTSDRMEPATVVVAPLKVVFLHTRDDVPLAAVKLLLSIVFPLTVAAAEPRAAARDPGLRPAWLAFGAGAVYAYGLAETGPRMIHGNFLWSGQAAAAVLFVASARFATARVADGAWEGRTGRPRLLACLAAFSLHVAAGVGYAVHFARTGKPF